MDTGCTEKLLTPKRKSKSCRNVGILLATLLIAFAILSWSGYFTDSTSEDDTQLEGADAEKSGTKTPRRRIPPQSPERERQHFDANEYVDESGRSENIYSPIHGIDAPQPSETGFDQQGSGKTAGPEEGDDQDMSPDQDKQDLTTGEGAKNVVNLEQPNPKTDGLDPYDAPVVDADEHMNQMDQEDQDDDAEDTIPIDNFVNQDALDDTVQIADAGDMQSNDPAGNIPDGNMGNAHQVNPDNIEQEIDQDNDLAQEDGVDD